MQNCEKNLQQGQREREKKKRRKQENQREKNIHTDTSMILSRTQIYENKLHTPPLPHTDARACIHTTHASMFVLAHARSVLNGVSHFSTNFHQSACGDGFSVML